jgi:16S rRNA pseudouridine516 synthase
MRIDQFLAHAGYGTRTEVKKLIKTKVIKVENKVVIDPKTQLDPAIDRVTVYDQEITYRQHVYLMMNKPPNYLSATRDLQHKTVIDLLDKAYQRYQVVPVGRLDLDTEGFMLLTNDGKLVHEITAPNKKIYKRYLAHITGDFKDTSIKKLQNGVEILDGNKQHYQTKPAKLKTIATKPDRTIVKIEIAEGKFHQVKRMFASVGCQVIYLKRLAIGDLELDPTLALGEYRELTEAELQLLKSMRG